MPAWQPLTDTPAAHAGPRTAVRAALGRLRRRLPRMVLMLLAVCLGIAVLLTALSGGRFGVKLGYSLCIGLACNLVNDAAWLAQAWAYDRWRALRGLPPAPGPFASGWGGVIPAAGISLLVGPTLGQSLADGLFGFNSPSLLTFSDPGARMTLVISLLATVVLIIIVSTFETLASARAQAEAAQRQAAETQLRLLQSQLEPHMLFNTLANLRVLIGMDAARAQAMLDHLIAFLRATLAASRRAEHPLGDEFARLSDYLALMTVRMGTRLAVQLDLPPDLKGLPVPPLLLQPLVENCIQHGLEPQVAGGWVRVSARREGAVLALEVQDNGVGRAAAAGQAAAPGRTPGGFGLAGVRERIQTLYGAAASISLEDGPEGQGTVVRLHLPIGSGVGPGVAPRAMATVGPTALPRG